jgi:hypothetical protein
MLLKKYKVMNYDDFLMEEHENFINSEEYYQFLYEISLN